MISALADVLPAPILAGLGFLIAFPFVGVGLLISSYMSKAKKHPRRNTRRRR